MSNENYINHPTFGLLFRVCQLDTKQELFTTLYAQRLFFLVTNTADGLNFEPVTRSDAKLMVETRLRQVRSSGLLSVYQQLNDTYKRTFL